MSEAFLTVFDHPAPVVAAVNGHPIAGGLCGDEGATTPASRAAIDAGVELDAKVRAVWKSDETRGRISAVLDALK